jgi:hypothetical protein
MKKFEFFWRHHQIFFPIKEKYFVYHTSSECMVNCLSYWKWVFLPYPITGQTPSATTRVVRDQILLNPKPDKGSIMG